MFVKDLNIPEAVKGVLSEWGYDSLYPPQVDAVRAGVLDGVNLVLAIPTASGKTLIAELCMVKSVLNGGKAIYLVPLRALASEKFEEFAKWKGLGIRVGLSTGDFDSSGSELGRFDILVCTNEKADSLLRHHADWISKISVIVADEVHLINSVDRGPTLEVVLARLRQVSPFAQIIALSATISNAVQLAGWLDAKFVLSDWRPVILKEGIFYNEVINFSDGSSHSVPLVDPELSICLALDTVKSRGQALIFDSTRRNAVSIARRLSGILSGYLSRAEKKAFNRVAQQILRGGEITQISKQLSSCIEGGVAFHHAGLSYNQRKIVEENFKNNLIKVVCATPTLAAGVNLPARRVIIRNYRRYDSNFGYRLIPVLEYKQMAGRAGRPKYDSEGDAVLIAKSAGEENLLREKYIEGAPETIESKLASESFLRTQTLATIASGYASDRQGIMDFLEKTFYAYQFGSDFIEIIIGDIITFLLSEEMIKSQENILVASLFGKRISELYIDPMSAMKIRDGLKLKLEQNTDIGYLHLISSTPDMPRLYLGRKDYKELSYFADEHRFELRVSPPEEYEDPSEYEWFLSELKMTYLLERWINEASEDQIISQFNVGSGDILRFVETADWLLYATYEIAKLLKIRDELSNIQRLRLRLKYGVKEELLELVKLSGVGRIRARRLFNVGLKTLRDLASVKVEELAKIPTIGKEIAKKIKTQLNNVTEEDTKISSLNNVQKSLTDFK
ncbi:MAG: ATP-dependent DNA helicase [Candidatus Jordarchaeum sp.]|uniref:ATP-dependent DNA helicase n=1 Tax=Candidatus Jordarchaeum sp. TaxID=2823881 RepID=UPI00404A9A66